MSKVKELREANGISQEFMACFLGMSPPNYSKKEGGSIKFSLAEAKRIADYFQKTIEDVFFTQEVSEIETAHEE